MANDKIKKSVSYSDLAKSGVPEGSAEKYNSDFGEMIKEVVKMQAATDHIMPMVREEIQKGWKQIPNTEAKRSTKSWMFDPLTLQYSLGYKDKKFSLSYDVLKRVANQLALVSAIINTRCAQVASFAQPYRLTRSLGFVIRHKDNDHKTTSAEVAMIKELENFILNCGRAEPNPYSRTKRDDFEDFLRKIIRDSLIFDASCAEVVPDRLGIPYEFMAVDASTIRFASSDRYVGMNSSFHERSGFVPNVPARFAGLYEGRDYGNGDVRAADGGRIEYVQVINGQIENVYSRKEMMYGIRNPRTDLYTSGYGQSELESLITIVTAHLYAETYNRKFFSNGTAAKGILNLKGDNWTEDQLASFQRHWGAQVTGVDNSHKIPVLQSDGIEWISFDKTNREMEYGQWIDYLTRTTCAVYLMDPSELNFEMHGSTQQTPLFESSQEWKLKASRDRGLKPLLRFVAKMLNKSIIDQIDDHFMLEFVGLDELSELDKHNMLTEQIASYMTLNEARRQLDLPDLEGGDIPMNPTYLEAMRLNMEKDQAQQQQDMMGAGGADQQPTDQPAEPPMGLPGSNPDLVDEGPQYSDNFGMNNPTEQPLSRSMDLLKSLLN